MSFDLILISLESGKISAEQAKEYVKLVVNYISDLQPPYDDLITNPLTREAAEHAAIGYAGAISVVSAVLKSRFDLFEVKEAAQ